MRDLILKRIEEIRIQEKDFPKDTMRWRNYLIRGNHISETGFQNLTEESLLEEFERLVVRCSRQM
jgi:hypothetical protein